MIRYALVCTKRHAFESWFASSSAYDQQAKRGLVTCPVCGTAKVEKALMTPRLARASKSAAPEPESEPPERAEANTPPVADAQAAPPVSEPATPDPATPESATPVAMLSPHEQEVRKKLRELRDHLVKNAENVGPRFPEEARKMHYGETGVRSIYGIASPEDAKALSDEGIEFSPLPVLPDERN
jgi:hypothetical protein